MSKMIRLTKDEFRVLEDKTRKINKELVRLEKSPMKESEMLHKILLDAIEKAEINRDGEVVLGS
ncbi:hypothetical protein [Pseudoalteromonas sp. B530]|uniref:hypothetical protein n=1 Tax=Pseudoalteromonas sp. B530 TaxID=2994390 RepID=UPI00224ACCE3|nr:hypothetical protein [Pseudoalteromonas sp. B530]MCX2765450.1 hypothetical protein [Pseudoalteromonas sp. B530]MCX2765461.1 hypothetical protein [Pseudoalteromonas sp. B530]